VDLDQRALQLPHPVRHRVLVRRVLHTVQRHTIDISATHDTHTTHTRARHTTHARHEHEPSVDVVGEPVAEVGKGGVDVREQDQPDARLLEFNKANADVSNFGGVKGGG
jgi:hypothetical protein